MGRAHYAVWALEVDAPRALERMVQVQRALAAHIHPVPRSQAHITAWVGGFVDGDGQRDDDLDWAVVAEMDARIQAQGRALRVQLGGASSFLSCPFLEVLDPGSELYRLREGFGSIHPKELRFSEFTPHLTLGTYAATEATDPLVEILRPFRDLPPLELTLNCRRARVDAASGALHWV